MDDETTVFASLEVDTDGQVDEAILHNWRGISRLFAAVLLAQPPVNFGQKRPQHLCPKLLWITVAGIAKHREKMDICAEVRCPKFSH